MDKYLALIKQLKVLCLCGPIVLLFDDGGSSSTDIGGTRGIPFSERKPKMDEAYEIDLESEDIDYEKALYVPLWIPVTYFAKELSKEFNALPLNKKELFIKNTVGG